ncbi:MAG: LysR family transcriptional regulator [Deltaproteobacteria bacterium]|nr:LysR family transcriptional regulator [Deltaproteobacteria bacterium]
MLPDLESLRCFESAATHLNFRVAARTVALSPAALGDRVKRLEDQLGVPLFARTTRRMALTAAGRRLLPHARRLLDDALRCRHLVQDRDEQLPFALTVGTRFELGLSWLTPALKALRDQHPERALNLVFGDSPDLLAHAWNRRIDCVVTSARLTGRNFDHHFLHDEDYVFVGASELLRRRALTLPAHAAAHVLLDVSPELPLFRYFLDASRRRDTWNFKAVEYLGTIGAIRLRLLQGAGVAVVPRYFVAKDLAARRLVALLPKVILQRDAFRLVWRTGHPLHAELRTLADDLAKLPLR